LALGQPVVYSSIAEIHSRQKNLLQTPAQIGYNKFSELLSSPEIFKFCFVREPLHRVASAYESKMTWQSDVYTKLVKAGIIPAGTRLTFVQFLELLQSSTSIRDRDEHWRLQGKQICYDTVNFDRIALFEELETGLAAILRAIFHCDNYQVFDARAHNFAGYVTGSAKRVAQLSEVERELALEIYRKDFEMYDQIVGGSVGGAG
jgi:hypothetical protein